MFPSKKTLLCFLAALAISARAVALEPVKPPLLEPLPQQTTAANMAAELLTHYHYKQVPLDAAMSEKIFDRYLKALDPERFYFLKSDIDTFSRSRSSLHVAIRKGDLRVPFAIFNLFERRLAEQIAYSRELLPRGFDFTRQESLPLNRDKADWPATRDEMRDLWRKRVKNDWLRLKLAGKDDKSIRDTLGKRYDNLQSRVLKYSSEDVFQFFLNAYAMSVEPHTNYLGPRAMEDFDISMKLSLVGIGAVLEEWDEHTVIRELMAGGPAARSGKLEVGDRILAVGQGEDGTPTEVLGWRIDDVVRLIRGEKDTVVTLDILPAEAGADAPHKTVRLIRDKISLEKQAAKKTLQTIRQGQRDYKVGIITLPSFYEDFEARRRGDTDYRSASRDVARLLGELKNEKVDSVLIDLRNNGGGSLDEAVTLTGLFIDTGPVVQRRDGQGRVKVEHDRDAGTVWDGPLGVLINRSSASASEIFAAALQDYGRALIIGEPSFGKGTVQTLVNLDRARADDTARLGEVKLTVEQFFRVNGGTTQLKGVTPDIALPSLADPEHSGEAGYDNALPWTSIAPAEYLRLNRLTPLLPALQYRHAARIKADTDFSYIREDIAELTVQRKRQSLSLNEVERRRERDAREARLKARRKAGDNAAKEVLLKDDGLQSSERDLRTELAAEKARKEARDPYLDEAAHILVDETELASPEARLTAAPPDSGTLH